MRLRLPGPASGLARWEGSGLEGHPRVAGEEGSAPRKVLQGANVLSSRNAPCSRGNLLEGEEEEEEEEGAFLQAGTSEPCRSHGGDVVKTRRRPRGRYGDDTGET